MLKKLSQGQSKVSLTPKNPSRLLINRLLELHEGIRDRPYKDSVGILTIGIGRNLQAKPLSRAAINFLLEEDLVEVRYSVRKSLPWSFRLDPVRLAVLHDMAFNLGINGLLSFKNTLDLFERGEYEKAADNMLKSKWAKQVGARAVRLSNMVRTGMIPDDLPE